MAHRQTLVEVLLEEIDGDAQDLRVADLPDFVQQFELRLQVLIEHQVIQDLAARLENARLSADESLLIVGSDVYDVFVRERDVLRPNTLGITVLKRGTPPEDVVTESAQLHGSGQFNEIEVVIDQSIGGEAEPLLELATVVLRAGYRCLEDIVRRVFRGIQSELVDRLYRKLRIVLAPQRNASVVEKVWFGIIVEEEGFWVLDENAADSVFESLGKPGERRIISPTHGFTLFVSTRIPFELMASKEAVQARKPVDLDLSKAKYLDTLTDFEKSEEAILKSPALTSLPVYCSDYEKAEALLLCFPTVVKQEVLPLVTPHLDLFRNIYLEQRSKVTQLRAELRRRCRSSELISTCGEFSGNFFAGWLKSMMKP